MHNNGYAGCYCPSPKNSIAKECAAQTLKFLHVIKNEGFGSLDFLISSGVPYLTDLNVGRSSKAITYKIATVAHNMTELEFEISHDANMSSSPKEIHQEMKKANRHFEPGVGGLYPQNVAGDFGGSWNVEFFKSTALIE
jgi:hypothetical protein